MSKKSLSKELMDTIFNSPFMKNLEPEERELFPHLIGSLSARDTADSVKNIKKRVAEILERVEENYDAIEKIGEEINSCIEQAALQESVNNVQSASDILKGYLETREAFNFAAEKGFIESELNNLIRYITQVREVGGRYGIFQAAPGLALWVQVYVSLQGLRPEEARIPVEHTSFYKKNMGGLEKIFEINKRIVERNQEEWESMPRAMEAFEFDGEIFRKISLPYYNQYSSENGRANLFSLRMLKTDHYKIALVSTTTFEQPSGVIHPGKDAPRLPDGGWRWALVNNSPSYFWEDKEQVENAFEAWKTMENKHYLVKQSYDCFKEAEYWEDLIKTKCANNHKAWQKAEIFNVRSRLKVGPLN